MEASLIIGYHNEAGLVQLLLDSIAKPIRERIEVIFVDDCSTETYDYEYDGESVYVRLEERKGIGNAFDVGVSRARTNNIILSAGDIVFKGDKWLDYFLEDISKDNKSFTCSTCLGLTTHETDVYSPAVLKYYGAFIITFVTAKDVENAPEDLRDRFSCVSSNDDCGVKNAVKQWLGSRISGIHP